MDADVMEVVPKVVKQKAAAPLKQTSMVRTPVQLAGPTDAELELADQLDDFSAGSIFIKMNSKSMWCDENVDAALRQGAGGQGDEGGGGGAQG
eukprot:599840-Prymnesium_polylepis.1